LFPRFHQSRHYPFHPHSARPLDQHDGGFAALVEIAAQICDERIHAIEMNPGRSKRRHGRAAVLAQGVQPLEARRPRRPPGPGM
jgi:hypothetical protein